MVRKSRTTNKTLLIVCEGSETENKYFTDACKYAINKDLFEFVGYKIVPTVKSDDTKEEINKESKRKKRQMSKVSMSFYTEACEDTDSYNIYKAQPRRYVREAYLLGKDVYTDIWAVFDNDCRGSGKTRKQEDVNQAFEDAKEFGVHIAYSSYCFEQWFLAHFERNHTAFQYSKLTLKQEQDTTINHEEVLSEHLDNLPEFQQAIGKGNRYDKTFPHFTRITLNRLQTAYRNALWYQHLYKDEPWSQRNPYTDVDGLMRSILGSIDNIQWCSLNETSNLFGCNVVFSVEGNNLLITNNSPQIFSYYGPVEWMDDKYQSVGTSPKQNVPSYEKRQFNIPIGATICRIGQWINCILIEL